MEVLDLFNDKMDDSRLNNTNDISNNCMSFVNYLKPLNSVQVYDQSAMYITEDFENSYHIIDSTFIWSEELKFEDKYLVAFFIYDGDAYIYYLPYATKDKKKIPWFHENFWISFYTSKLSDITKTDEFLHKYDVDAIISDICGDYIVVSFLKDNPENQSMCEIIKNIGGIYD